MGGYGSGGGPPLGAPRGRLDDAVRELLRRAAEHPLGPDFVRKGAPDAVAATFGVHAFVVDAARHARVPAGRDGGAVKRG